MRQSTIPMMPKCPTLPAVGAGRWLKQGSCCIAVQRGGAYVGGLLSRKDLSSQRTHTRWPLP